MAEEVSATPALFKRIWLHTTEVKAEISANGCNPDKLKRSIYGSAIYLALRKWDLEDEYGHLQRPTDRETLMNDLRDPKIMMCVLVLQSDEVMSCFGSDSAQQGSSEKHLLAHLNQNVPRDKTAARGALRRIGPDEAMTALQVGRSPVSGDHQKNKRIAHYFLTKGIKAVSFFEHGEEVVAVYDPNCIRVLPQSTKFTGHPFVDLLAANDNGPAA